jgi:perosamine synthetase
MTDAPEEVPLFEIDWNESDIEAVSESIKRGGYWAKGPYVDEFESKLEQYLGVEHALVVNSGTTALVSALQGLGIGEGDEVIVPSFTFIATANAVRLTGAEPVFADIETQTYGLSPSDVESKITESTVGILPVHCYGTSCRIKELSDIANENEIRLIEDAAEVLGAKYNGQKLGTFGDASALSFCQNKITPTGEGGAVVTNDGNIAKEIELYRSHGRATDDYFDSADSGHYVRLGTNIRMSDLTAALGCSQMERITTLIESRQQVAQRYDKYLKDIDGVHPHESLSSANHVYQLYTIELAEWVNRERVIEALRQSNISSKVYWDPPVHQTEYYTKTAEQIPTLPNTEKIASRVLSLPMYPGLSDKEIERVASGIRTAVD